tara:strand:+ start:582 stop:743 length:162 start_codon:yes stop_codon:yes gene_type:complete
MADYFDSNDLNVPDKSPLKTGNVRKKYNQSKCGKGYKSVNGKCVKINRGNNGK